jgi:hypothetical protein
LHLEETWLLIFDNAESPAALSDFWPRSSNGAIILTTQDTRWLSQEYIIHGTKLDSLIKDEGIELVKGLFERKQRTITMDEAVTIFEETGGLPLAMRQIASYILAEGLSVAQFLENYQSHRSSRTIDAWEESTTPWYSYTLATFLNVTFARLTPREICMLAIISFLDVDKIQEDLFCHEGLLTEDEDALFWDPLQFVNIFCNNHPS